MENFQEDHLSNIGLQVDGEVRRNLYDAGKWSKFIALVMFIACGFILIFGIIGGTSIGSVFKRLGSAYNFLDEISGVVFIIFIVAVVAIVAFVYYFLFNFSRKIQAALISESTAEFNAGLKSLKIYFIITTAFAILSLLISIYNLF